MENIKCSKYLSYLLRHGAEKHNLNISKDGYVSLNQILNLPQSKSFQIDVKKVKMIVESNDKKRFELKTNDRDELFIRACQGHSIKHLNENEMMTEISNPHQFSTVVHGTREKAFSIIKKEGLKVMNRNHIHFAIGYSDNNEVISGMRNNCQIFIEIDMEKAMNDGIKFYLSTNKVILSSGKDGVIDPKYFKIVRNKNRQVIE